ncbi:methyl-accepting chemotaxis protein [Magnetospirillum sulfuroxidans]|uniref:Methyl-accepting chemotaxis protein n=1 Tax=Magnetospirillum sulfuroxidans TaxID=611300 RepID=A0ABS5IDI9_9PROT|nr:methyl-accepting chemotaxis protein [Magnetospirillum sulfuroxidans]MBR9972465.1 methyl-accepting chemotaxis protein [Magnetospirillum sulfuroxidans]
MKTLRSLHEPSETAFLDIGERLREAHGASRNLAAMASALSLSMSEEGVLKTLNDLDRDIVLVNALLNGRGERQSGLKGICDSAERIDVLLRSLLKTMGYVRILATNAKIEATQVSNLDVDFQVFTREIERLALNGDKTVLGIRNELTALEKTSRDAFEALTRFDIGHRQELEDVSRRLRDSVAALKNKQLRAAEVLQAIPDELEGAARSIGEVVSALQISDMTRQRIEHVEHALDTLASALSAGTDHNDVQGLGQEQLLVFISGICSLQAHQVQSIRDAFAEKVAMIRSSLKSLTTRIDAIGQKAEDVHSGGQENGSSFLLEVEKDLETTAKILAVFSTAMQEMEHSLGLVTDKAKGIGSALAAVRDVDADMHLMGLNASIKCGKLGTKGRALNVIAGEIQASARETQKQVDQTASGLNAINASVRSLMEGESEGQQAISVAPLQTSLIQAVGALRQVGGKSAKVLAEIRKQGGEVIAAIDNSLAVFTIAETMQDIFNQAANQLHAVAKDSDPGLTGEEMERAKQKVVEFMHAHYTMVSERDVHQALFSTTSEEHETDIVDGDLLDVLF